ncbi:hypothetical protein B9Z19DRAFT_1061011 [Tuber borchii]|uniref:Uncharacterized protein n=1 Tax=Tuber borchii TaxID=42251 RepID=A0A2T7A6S2_TUBBO|nr:hypothetical protein B9Z19DRAFT_1061011 [Tuber borchii]
MKTQREKMSLNLSPLSSPKYRQFLVSAIHFEFLALLWLITLLPIPFTAVLLTSEKRRYALALHAISVVVLMLITMSYALYYYRMVRIELEDMEDRRQIDNWEEAQLKLQLQIFFEERLGSSYNGKGRKVGLVPLVKVPEKAWVGRRERVC